MGMATVALALFSGAAAYAQKTESITAVAMGTSTQLGRVISVEIRIYEYSTPDDQAALLEAFQSNGSQGLSNAIDKMKSKGRIAITGTVGYDLNYVRKFQQPDGSRIIRFVTDRPIRIGEAWSASRSMDYDITLGEIIIPAAGGKNSGTILPATKVTLNKKGELEMETLQNPWQLTNIKVHN